MDSLFPPNSPSSPTTCPCPTCKTWRLSQAAKAAPALAAARLPPKLTSSRPNGWAAKLQPSRVEGDRATRDGAGVTPERRA